MQRVFLRACPPPRARAHALALSSHPQPPPPPRSIGACLLNPLALDCTLNRRCLSLNSETLAVQLCNQREGRAVEPFLSAPRWLQARLQPSRRSSCVGCALAFRRAWCHRCALPATCPPPARHLPATCPPLN